LLATALLADGMPVQILLCSAPSKSLILDFLAIFFWFPVVLSNEFLNNPNADRGRPLTEAWSADPV